LSINIIASFTTTQVRAINQIPNGILYGLPVKYNQIFTHKNASTIEYSTISGCKNELNWKTSIENIKNIEIISAFIVQTINSLFSSHSHDFKKLIPSG